MPSLQDAENSSEDEYDTVPEPSRIENGLSLDTHTKPHESYDEVPLPPTPAITASPDPGIHSDCDQSSQVTIGRSPTPDFQSSSQALRKYKRGNPIGSNTTQNPQAH
jgi:hypothetical protein